MSLLSTIGNFANQLMGREPSTAVALNSPAAVAETAPIEIVSKPNSSQRFDSKIWAVPGIKTVKSKDNFHEFRLANGMKVIVKQAKGTQISAHLRFGSGSTKDLKGCEGIAHFLEHIACNNTQNFGKELFPIADMQGGWFNAHTSYNETVYKILLPNDKLDLALRVLSSIMSKVKIDPQEYEKEKGIICSEIMMTEASPGRKVHKKLQEILYGKDHALYKDVIGTKASVQATSIEDLYKYYRDEYVPNNATLILSGDFDLNELKTGLDKYFGEFKPRPECKEFDEAQGIKPSSQREHIMRDDALIAGFNYAYAIPKFNHREELIADLISNALSGGDDSRLQRRLVDGEDNDGKGSASSIGAGSGCDKFKGHYYIYAKPLDDNLDTNIRRITEVVNAELRDIAANGLTDKEFARVIDRMENSETYSQDSQHAKIWGVVGYDEANEDWSKYFLRFDDIKTITNDEIKAFVSKYLIPANRHSLVVYGKGKELSETFADVVKQKNPDVKGKSAEDQIIDAAKFKKLMELSGGLSKLEARMEGLTKIRYANGMQLYHKEDRELPLSHIDVNFPGGSLLLPDEKNHIPSMLNSLLGETGTYNPITGKSLDKKDIENAKIKLGMRFGVGLALDTGGMHMAYLSKNRDESFALASEMLNYPALLETKNPTIVKRVEEELERQKKMAVDVLRIFEKFPAMLAGEKFAQTIYPRGHVFYQRNLEEAKQRIESTTVDDLRDYYKNFMHASNAQITAVGDIGRDDIETRFIPMIDAWNSSAKINPRNINYAPLAPVAPKPMSVQVVEAKDAKPESIIVIGNPMNIKVDDPDYYAAMLANNIFGSGGKSRLFESVREEHGLAYHVGSMISPVRHGCGPFSISLGCDPKNVRNAITEVMNTTRKFLKDGPTLEELEIAKFELKKSFALHALNSRASTCSVLSELQLRNKDEVFINNVNKIIDAISLDQVVAAARKFILPDNFTVVATVPKGFREKQQAPVVKKAADAQVKVKSEPVLTQVA